MKIGLTFIKIDVSTLAPPEPMTEILTQLARLTAQECLFIKHRRQPFPLYDKLDHAGFSYHCVVHAQDDITLYIFHQNAQSTFDKWLLKNGLATINIIKSKS